MYENIYENIKKHVPSLSKFILFIYFILVIFHISHYVLLLLFEWYTYLVKIEVLSLIFYYITVGEAMGTGLV